MLALVTSSMQNDPCTHEDTLGQTMQAHVQGDNSTELKEDVLERGNEVCGLTSMSLRALPAEALP